MPTTKTSPALTQAQRRTLRTIAARGGLVNGYMGQTGIHTLSLPVLVRHGLLAPVEPCAACTADHWEARHAGTCTAPRLDGQGGNCCYDRHQLTAAGRAVLAQIGR